MKLQIAWRNPAPPLRTPGRFETVVHGDKGSLYVLLREAKEFTFEVIRGGDLAS